MKAPVQSRDVLRCPLDEILGSEGNVRLLRLLANEVSGPLNAPEAARRGGLTIPGARKALGRLVQTGIVLRVGGGRSQQYALNGDEPLSFALRELFRAERVRYDAFVSETRAVFAGVSEVIAAWIDDVPVRAGDPLDVSVVVEAKAVPWIREELRTRLAAVERRFDQVIELSSYTEANAPVPDPERVIPLAGVMPQDKTSVQTGPVPHSERDERALRMSQGIAQLLRQDPSMVKRAVGHLERLLSEDQGTARGDLLEWRQVLETYSTERLRQFLMSTSSRATRLRQSSPFFAVMTAEERDKLVSYWERER